MSGSDAIAEALAGYVERLTLEDVPPEVGLRARHLMLDAIGCALAARREAFAERFWSSTRALVGDAAGVCAGDSAVIGYSQRLPLRDAVLMNGVMTHGLDYDDTHTAGVVHLSVSVLPSVLSLAARRGLRGADLLVAYIAGVEAGARVAMAVKGGFHAQGFHPTGLVGTFASAWAVGRLMRLDAERLVQAQGAALSMAAGSLQFIESGAWTKRLHAGWAAQAGLTAATLAREGVVAPDAPYSGRYGLYHSFLDEAGRAALDVSLATRGIGAGSTEPAPAVAHGAASAPGLPADVDPRTWELMQIAVKPFALCHFVHAAADAAIALHRGGLDARQVRSIDVLVPQAAVPLVCEPADRKRRPTNEYEAKFSLPYAVASGLMRGRVGLRELEPAAYQNDEAWALMDKVRYVVDEHTTFPRHYSGEVRVSMDDGTEHRHREAINRGNGDRPLSNDEVRAKFMDNAGLHFSSAHATAICDAVLGLDTLASVKTLEDLLGTDPQQVG